jgi:hypothetical protein
MVIVQKDCQGVFLRKPKHKFLVMPVEPRHHQWGGSTITFARKQDVVAYYNSNS